MRPKHTFWLPLVALLLVTALSQAQQWSGIISSSRATDWSGVGVEGGIPSATYTQSGSTIQPGSGSSKQTEIQNALNACSGGHFVKLAAGTFTIGGLIISNNGCVLRGSGADQTFLVITGSAPSSCLTGYNFAIGMCTGVDTKYSASWSTTPCLSTGNCQKTTAITLANHTGLVVGQPIVLTQNDDPSDGWAAAGDIYLCANTSGTPACSAQGGGDYAFDDATSGNSGYKVVSCGASTSGASCTSNTVTISPGIVPNYYRSGMNPMAYWRTPTTFIQNSGIEDLSIDYTNSGTGVDIHSTYAFNCWVKGIRSVFNGAAPSGTANFHVNWVRGIHDTVRDSYFYGPTTAAGAILLYPLTVQDGFAMLWENNIVQGPQGALVTDGPISGSVFSYNFFPGRTGPAVVQHNSGDGMNLFEGNVGQGFFGDIDHGTHFFDTLFRNAWVGSRYSTSLGTIGSGIQLQSKSRFYNIIGNVIGDSHFTSYETDLADDNGTSIYDLGWQGSASGSNPGTDTNVQRTLMRWGNWDSVTNATRFNASEVPSGIANFPNAVPVSQVLPASFYLSSKPSWWPSGKPWPAIGPDVSGGNVANTAGHAFTNAAADCYLNVMGGPTNGSGGPLSFNADTCYGAVNSGTQTPTAPSRLAAIVQ